MIVIICRAVVVGVAASGAIVDTTDWETSTESGGATSGFIVSIA